METFGNEIEIQQGENFYMDVVLSASNKEYIPYLVSSELKHPYFVITIASTKYEKNMRYVNSWWNNPLELIQLERFYQTVPYNLGDLDSDPDEQVIRAANKDESINHRYFYQYTLKSDKFNEEIGHVPYKYAFLDYNSGKTEVKIVDPDLETGEDKNNNYTCKVVQPFSSDITRLWGAQNYMYQITLVTGKTQKEIILQAYSEYGEIHPDFPMLKKEDGSLYTADEVWGSYGQEQEYITAAYNYIKKQWPSYLQPDIDVDSPLYYIDNPETITTPCKLTVNNNLRQMI